MEMDDFVINFEEQIEDIAPGSIKSDTVFKDLDEWDSLTVLTIITMIDDKYAVKITGDDLKKANTLADIYNIIEDRRKSN